MTIIMTATHVNLVGVYYINKNRDYYINPKISKLEVQNRVLCKWQLTMVITIVASGVLKGSCMYVCVGKVEGRIFTSLGDNYLMQTSLEVGDDVEQ